MLVRAKAVVHIENGTHAVHVQVLGMWWDLRRLFIFILRHIDKRHTDLSNIVTLIVNFLDRFITKSNYCVHCTTYIACSSEVFNIWPYDIKPYKTSSEYSESGDRTWRSQIKHFETNNYEYYSQIMTHFYFFLYKNEQSKVYISVDNYRLLNM